MGDTEGGSTAAQRAQDPDEGNQKGLFGRLMNAFQTPEEEDESAPTGLRRVLDNLRRLRVEDVSVPKAEIVAAPVDIGRDALIALFRDSGYSRIPVYEDTLDHPQGLLLLKDLALKYGFNGHHAFDLRPLLRPLIFAPPSMPLAVLLQKMQSERTHMALVIDEYGGVDGLVTIEDLIEQVVGEIEDEHDTEDETHWAQEKPGCYLAQARTPLDAFEAEIGLQLAPEDDRDEIDTLGGLVIMLSGRVPARGEVITHESGVIFEVVEADPRRIRRLRVRLPEALVDPA
ncbi:transporter associated domain-containing protein [Alkalilacustris brevis]|uniref:transporter associated domain-containing protein n=1 Tax=Alkalilacustris brevis TaxID=2026338 RepID=UPI000E0D4C64|nr:transporter associated domain-containing protein [Alkalilacustris brevis]